jgi:hypothetical protein
MVRLGWQAFAGLIATFGLLGIEIAVYLHLVQRLDAVLAAGLLGAANFLLAIILVAASRRTRASSELQLALDLQKAAVEALQADARALQTDIASVRDRFSYPFDGALTSLAVPAIGLLVKALKK